jgi:toxin ParE1/3/4
MAAGRFGVELTAGAEGDLEEICHYLAVNRSPDDAQELLDTLLDRIAMLEKFPERGSVPRELDALGIREFRQILLNPYRLIYRIIDRKVIVVVIADGRRDMQRLLERRLLKQ